jgi:hypothetical protein
MRAVLLLVVIALPVCAEWTLYGCVATTRNWVVGSRMLPSGVFRRSQDGQWTRVGFMHPITSARLQPGKSCDAVSCSGEWADPARGAWRQVAHSDRPRRDGVARRCG